MHGQVGIWWGHHLTWRRVELCCAREGVRERARGEQREAAVRRRRREEEEEEEKKGLFKANAVN